MEGSTGYIDRDVREVFFLYCVGGDSDSGGGVTGAGFLA
jgi:hypothetical protein